MFLAKSGLSNRHPRLLPTRQQALCLVLSTLVAATGIGCGSSPSPGLGSPTGLASNSGTAVVPTPATKPAATPGTGTGVVTTAGTPAPAVVLPKLDTPLTHQGRWLTDADGRVVIIHGINVASKLTPYTPQFQGFTKEHAAMLAREGFTNVRVWIFWKAFEPTPGKWDDSSLAATKEFVGWLNAYGITTTLNFSQLLWGEQFGGLGFPDWAADTDGAPNVAIGAAASGATNVPTPGGNLVIDGLSNPAVHRAFDNFYANTAYPDTMGVRDHFNRAWIHVANYFKDVPGVVAYDLFNEPEAGSQDDSCLNPAGCPQADATLITPFNISAVAAIRTVEPKRMIWYEPHVYTAAGTATQVAAGTDPNLALTYHFYPVAGANGVAITAKEHMTLLEQTAKTNKDALLLTEFGAKDDLPQIQGVIDAADDDLLGWEYWAWYSTEPTGDPATPTTEIDHPEEGIVLDPKKAPAADNLKADKLALLGRPYPYLVAGTPTAWHYDIPTRTFTLSYSTTPIAGGGALTVPTVIVVPTRNYPKGYQVQATNARTSADAASSTLSVTAVPNATTVSITITPNA